MADGKGLLGDAKASSLVVETGDGPML